MLGGANESRRLTVIPDPGRDRPKIEGPIMGDEDVPHLLCGKCGLVLATGTSDIGAAALRCSSCGAWNVA